MTDPRHAALAAGDRFMALLKQCGDGVRLEIHELAAILKAIRDEMREEADEGKAG